MNIQENCLPNAEEKIIIPTKTKPRYKFSDMHVLVKLALYLLHRAQTGCSIFLHRCQSGVKTEQYLRINERFRCKFATPGGKAVQAVQINEFDINHRPIVAVVRRSVRA